MSQQQTVRITTTETSHSSALIINTGYLTTAPGILKLLQFLLGLVCVAILTYHFNDHSITYGLEIFFLTIVSTFFICTTILLISCLFSWSTGGIISKTIYELIYHFFGFLLLLIASLAFIKLIFDQEGLFKRNDVYKPFLAIAIIGILNSLLYGASTFYARRSYKGI